MSNTLKHLVRDGRIFHLAIIVIVIASVYIFVPLPMPVRDNVKDFYNTIMGLKSTDVVWIRGSIDSTLLMSCREGAIDALKTLKNLNVNIVAFSPPSQTSGSSETVYIFQSLLTIAWGPDWDKSPWYGTKFVYLGYQVVSDKAMFLDLRTATGGKDYRDVSFDDLPLMKNINTGCDIDCVIGMRDSPMTADYPIPYMSRDPKPIVLKTGSPDDITGAYYTDRAAGYINGLLDGAQGAAEYEIISGMPGNGMSYMIAASGGLLFMAIGVTISTIYFVTNKYLRRKEQK